MAEMMNPALEGATLLFPQGSFITAYAYTGVEERSRHIRPAHGLERRL